MLAWGANGWGSKEPPWSLMPCSYEDLDMRHRLLSWQLPGGQPDPS